MDSHFLFQRIWQTGRQEVNISQIRRWLILKHKTCWKTMLENPWILIQNDFLRSRVFKMIWANFSAFVHLETVLVRPSGPIVEHVWILAGPKSYAWFSPKIPVWFFITYFSGNLRSLLHPNTAQQSPFAVFYLCRSLLSRKYLRRSK